MNRVLMLEAEGYNRIVELEKELSMIEESMDHMSQHSSRRTQQYSGIDDSRRSGASFDVNVSATTADERSAYPYGSQRRATDPIHSGEHSTDAYSPGKGILVHRSSTMPVRQRAPWRLGITPHHTTRPTLRELLFRQEEEMRLDLLSLQDESSRALKNFIRDSITELEALGA